MHWSLAAELRDLLSRSNWPKRAATASSSKRPRPPSTKSVESFSALKPFLFFDAPVFIRKIWALKPFTLCGLLPGICWQRLPCLPRLFPLTRRTLDEALLERAKQAGANILRGFTVERLLPPADEESRGLWRAKITNASHISMYISGSETFLATGKHDLRGWQRQTNRSHNTLVALKMYFRLSPEQSAQLAGNVELIFYPGGYAGLQPVEGNAANLCALINREKLRSMGSRWDRLLEYMRLQSPHLERRLTGAESLLDRPLALSSIPYGFSVESSFGTESPWRLGDQAAVIPSLCGDGMGIALHTARRAAELYLRGKSAAVFHDEVRHQFGRRLYFSTLLSRAIVAMPALAHITRVWPSALSDIFAATRVPGASIHTETLGMRC